MPDSDNRAVATVTGFTQVITPGDAVVQMSDDFNGSGLDVEKWTATDESHGFLTISESGGQLQSSVNVTTSAVLSGAVRANESVDLSNGYVKAQLAAPAATYGDIMVTLFLDSYVNGPYGPQGGGDYLSLSSINGAAPVLISGLGSVPWSAETMSFVRIRSWQGHVYYEVSPDGTSWTTLWTNPVAEGVITPMILFSCAPTSYPPGNVSGTAAIESFEIATTPPNAPTPAATGASAVVTPDGAILSMPAVTAGFGYGDYVNEAVIDAVRAAVGDPQLEVTIV